MQSIQVSDYILDLSTSSNSCQAKLRVLKAKRKREADSREQAGSPAPKRIKREKGQRDVKTEYDRDFKREKGQHNVKTEYDREVIDLT